MKIFLNNTAQDIRYALRQLRKSPGFALTVIMTLALGIGTNTAIFTLVQGILLRSLPVNDPKQLYRIGDTDDCCVNGGFSNENGDFAIFSYDLYLHLRDAAPEFERLAAVQSGQNSYYVRCGESEAPSLRVEYVTGNFFSTLGINAFLGRLLNAADDVPGASTAIELSYASWQSDFAGVPSVVGSTIFIQTHPFTVAGVAPPGFFGDRVTGRPAAIWVPLNDEPLVEGPNSILHHADANWLYPIGRLRTGVNVAALNAKLSESLRRFLYTRPIYAQWGATSEIPKQHVASVFGVLALVLACVGLYGVMSYFVVGRTAEIGIRMALGASKRGVISVVLRSALMQIGLGLALGVPAALLAGHMMKSQLYGVKSYDPPALCAAVAVLALCAAIAGFNPARRAASIEPMKALRTE